MELADWLTRSVAVDFALLLGRLFIGICFVIHGLGKLGWLDTGNMAGFVAWREELGVPLAPLQARIAMLSEIAGGTALALGLLTRPACLLLIATMVVAGLNIKKGIPMSRSTSYIPARSFKWLTPLYDPLLSGVCGRRLSNVN